MKIKELGALFLLAALWGGSFLFMRIASPVLGPFVTIELRVLIAGLVLLGYALFIKRPPNLAKRWKQYLMMGTFNAAIPFTLIATATLTLSASFATILNSTTPLFTAMVAWGWLKEKLTFKKGMGIILGVSGVAIMLGYNPVAVSSQVIFSASLSILAAASYGFAGVYAKKKCTGIDSLSLAIGQQLAAALILLPIALTKIPLAPISNIVIISMGGLALFCTALAYLLYYYLIASVGPTKTLMVTFLMPLFGVIWGVIFLNENITGAMILGLMIILSSVFMISDVKMEWGNMGSGIEKKNSL